MSSNPTPTASNEDELNEALIAIFTPIYTNRIATAIAGNLVSFYEEQEYEWETIKEDIEFESVDECLGIDDVIETLQLNKIKIADGKQKNELFQLLQSCKLTKPKPKQLDPSTVPHKLSTMASLRSMTSQPSIIIQQHTDRMPMNDLKDKIYKEFNRKYFNQDHAITALKAFKEVIEEDDYDFEDVLDDLKDYDGDHESEIVESLGHKLQFTTEHEIWQILKKALSPIEVFNPKRINLSVNDEEIKRAHKFLETYCPSILTDANSGEIVADRALSIAKAIDMKNNDHNLLLLLYDTYSRYRLDGYMKTVLNEPDIPSFGYENSNKFAFGYDIPSFWSDYAYAKWLSRPNSKYDTQRVHHLKLGLSSLNRRLVPRMTLKNFGYIICDRLHDFVDYAVATSKFINIVSNGDLDALPNGVEENEEKREKSPAILPLSFDFWIIPQCTKVNVGVDTSLKWLNHLSSGNTLLQSATSNTAPDDDDSDSDDSDVDDNAPHTHLGSNDDGYRWFGHGGHLKKGRPRHPIGSIAKLLNKNGYEKNIDYVTAKIESNKVWKNKFRIFAQLYKEMNRKRKALKRYIFIIDRRNPKYYLPPQNKNKKINGENRYSLGNKHWKDVIYCIKPKKYASISSKYHIVPELFFELTRKFLLPTTTNTDDDEHDIGVMSDVNGYMFNLSYHIYNVDTIRLYWCFNREMQRFFKSDMQWFWPKCFVQRKNHKNGHGDNEDHDKNNQHNKPNFNNPSSVNIFKDDMIDQELMDDDLLIDFAPLNDDEFLHFYQQTTKSENLKK